MGTEDEFGMIGTEEDVTQDLTRAVGGEHVSSRPSDVMFYARDCWARRHLMPDDPPRHPVWVVWPGAASEVARVLQVAGRHELAVVPYGGGSNLVGGAGFGDDRPVLVVDTKRMSRVLELDETSLIVQAQAGITGGDLDEYLRVRGLFVAHMPTSLSQSTLGGWLATRSAGAFTSRYGRIDRVCMGITAALPDGSVVRTRVAPRRATGPDLMHLFLGSEGALGIITAAHLKVVRVSKVRVWLAGGFKELSQAVAAMADIMSSGTRPVVASIADPVVALRHSGQPSFMLVCSFEGDGELPVVQRDEARLLVLAHGGAYLDPAAASGFWTARRNDVFGDIIARAESRVIGEVDIGADWRHLAMVADDARGRLESMGCGVTMELGFFGLEGGALLCKWQLPEISDPEDVGLRQDEALAIVLDAARRGGGAVAHHRGVGRQRSAAVRAQLGNRFDLFADVKRQLDPKGLMNPWLTEGA
ncbi:MAG: FAD-binding oxidoreductase [Deltaproteobacteria bacterium]|nr:FAD-binding oxidoreductase [Deltaproteobacteria bacterium]